MANGVLMGTVLICNKEDQDKANLLADLFGYGPENFSIPLSSTGSEPVTHVGGYLANGVDQSFVNLILDANIGVLPPFDWPPELPVTDVILLLPKLTIRFNDQWENVLTELNLKTIKIEEN